jgi:hypothetical protein
VPDIFAISSASPRELTTPRYDNASDRTSQTVGSTTTSSTPNDANCLISVNGVPVVHDANGNVTGDGTRTYAWDVRGRLVGLTGSGADGRVRHGLSGAPVSEDDQRDDDHVPE